MEEDVIVETNLTWFFKLASSLGLDTLSTLELVILCSYQTFILTYDVPDVAREMDF